MRIQRQWNGKEWWITLLAGVVGLALSFLAAWYVDVRSQREVETDFLLASDRLVQQLERRLDSLTFGIRGVHGLLGVTRGRLSDQDLRNFLANRKLDDEFPGAQGIGFVRRIQNDETDAYIKRQQRIRPVFNLQTVNNNPSDRFMVETLEPHELNWARLGLDVASMPQQRDAAQEAMHSGEARLSTPVLSDSRVRDEKLLFYFHPFYRSGMSTLTESERDAALEGWIYAPILPSRLLANLQPPQERLFDFELFAGDKVVVEHRLYDDDSHAQRQLAEGITAENDAIWQRKYSRRIALNIGNQPFTLLITSLPSFENTYSKRNAHTTFFAGFTITVLLCWAFWLIGRTRRHALQLAEEMSAAARDREAQINAVLNNTVESIITVNQHGTIKSLNRAAQQLFGYSAEEICGCNAALLSTDPLVGFDEPGIRKIVARNRAAVDASAVEVQLRDKKGRIFPAELSVGEFAFEDETLFVGMVRDISWRKQQEEEKAAIQERLQLALNAAGFGVWQWWPDTRCFEWDSNTCRLHGIDPEDYPHDYESWAKLIHEDDLERVVRTMRDVFNGSSKNSEVFRVRWPDGTIRYQAAHVRVVRDSHGRASAIGVSQDVTAPKMTEESLRMSEERFALAARAAQEGIWDWDLRSGQIWFSPQWKAHFGYRDDELENSLAMWERLILPEDHDEGLNLVGRFNRGEIDRFEAIQRFRHKDGHVVFIRSRAVQLRNEQGDVVRIVGSHEDMTEILRQENDLRDSRERLALTIDCAGLGTWDRDLVNNQIVYGGKWGEMLGYTREEIPNDVLSWQTLVHPDDFPAVISAHEAHWRGETAIYQSEYRMRSQCGEWRWVLSVGRVVARDAELRPLRMLGVNIDVNERKKNEAALQEARKLAEEASRAKSEFLANISHEIRTPLNAVLGFSSLLTETPLTARQSDFVDSIHTAGDALLTLINDLLDFSKIEAGHLDLEEIEFDTRSTLEETLDIVATKAAAKGINLACLVESSTPARLIGDPSRLRQILLNLLINAVKFTERGEVIARARAKMEADGRVCLRVEVKDSGIGISPAIQLKLFRPFTQADASTTRRFGGTGLGLSICRRLSEAMGGTIGVQSQPGHGAMFWFEVYLKAAPTQALMPLLPTDCQGRTVLVIDAEAINRELLTLQLESIGLRAECHGDSATVLTRLQAPETDYLLVILGQHAPCTETLSLAETIHAEEKWRDLPVLLLTSLATPELASTARDAGIAGFVTKPVRQLQLLACIREALHLQNTLPPGTLAGMPTLPQWLAEERPYLLLAEDNPVNQKVAALMLDGLGCRVDVVENGVAAICALGQRAYDLVLMDCQMPEMDGYTATEHIRAMPGICSGIPIVALTANAFRTDAERCFKAGMNDFVSKPFTREQLLHVLLRWLPAQRNATAQLPLDRIPGAANNEAKQGKVLQQELNDIETALDELKSNLGMDMRADLLALYFPTQDECLQQMEMALTASDMAQTRSFAHKLKGAAGQLGAKGLAACCLGIEHACRDSDLHKARMLYEALRELALGVRQRLCD